MDGILMAAVAAVVVIEVTVIHTLLQITELAAVLRLVTVTTAVMHIRLQLETHLKGHQVQLA